MNRPRDILLKVRWGSKQVTLRSENGNDFLGGTGEPGLLLLLRRDVEGRFTARIEDRTNNNSWASREPKRRAESAVSNLHREMKRLSRAAGLGRAA